MRKDLFIFIISALLLSYSAPILSLQTGSKVIITGRVIDATTYQPLENVNVFIANTMIGAATNSQGVYEIKNVPLGRSEMVVTMIGYKTRRLQLKLTKSKRYQYDFKMKTQAISAPSIEISAKESKKWRKKLKKFQEHFLGTSQNASYCTIRNPEVLEFKDGTDGSKHYIAIAHEPLEIENRALGYRLYFLLNTFESKNNQVIYGGDARFEEIASANIIEKKTWQENRQKTYNGSLRHFLASLNSNRFRRAGFYAENVLDMSRDKMSGLRSEIRKHEILTSGELPNEKRINFNDYLEVLYTDELEEEAYVDYRLRREFASGFKKPESLSKLREPLEQKSWIALNGEHTTMDTSGHLIDPLSITTYGYWAWQRVGDMLPLDYTPWEYGAISKQQAAVTRDYYKDGKLMLDAGNWDKAIEIWSEGKQVLEESNLADPRIAIAFVEQVTQKEANFYYEKACDFYYWGFSTDQLEKYRNDIAEEIERIAPLLPKEDAEGWRIDLEKKRPVVLSKIKAFWISRDPNPASTLNERLIEHWERISYARKNFDKGNSTVYGTDDRGLIYVKYGAPDQKREVTLGNNSQEIRTVANMLQIPAFTIAEFIRAVEQFLDFPDCEIWSYRRLSREGHVNYLFGKRGGSGAFGLRDSVEDFIPRRAFTKTSGRYTNGIIPGSIIQMMFYSQLSTMDPIYSSRVGELEENLVQANRFQSSTFSHYRSAKGLREKFIQFDINNPIKKFAPPEQFNPENYVTPIQVAAMRSRFLDKNNNPSLVFVAFAFPAQNSTPNPLEVLKSNISNENSQLAFSLLLRDKDMNATERYTAKPIANFDNTAIFRIPHNPDQAHYTLSAVSDKIFNEYGNPAHVGKALFEKVDPLDPDIDKLEISDLVIGVEPPNDINQEQLPFPLVQTEKIWRQDVLRAYFEVYHLKLDDGMGRFSIDGRIIKLVKKGGKFERRELVATTFDFNSSGRTAKEDFGISIANFEPGNYELEVEVKDSVSGQKKKRVAPFEIREMEFKSDTN